MKKIEVKVCLGTICFVMGSSHLLQDLKVLVPNNFGDSATVTESTCLGICAKNWDYSKAPYVKVNDVIVQRATAEKVLAEIERQLNNND